MNATAEDFVRALTALCTQYDVQLRSCSCCDGINAYGPFGHIMDLRLPGGFNFEDMRHLRPSEDDAPEPSSWEYGRDNADYYETNHETSVLS